ncbi:MAG TPA: hypothetical protein VGL95_08780 [Acetobacteraceae bacterium]|jgi:hypothetical protein
MAFAFDTLAYAKHLQDSGIPPQQAEAHAEAAREFIMAELVTKPDLAAVREEAAATKLDLLASDAATRRELEASMDTLSLRLTVRLGSMMAAGLSLMTAILSALIRFH